MVSPSSSRQLSQISVPTMFVGATVGVAPGPGVFGTVAVGIGARSRTRPARPPFAVTQFENSDVLPSASVAVAVTTKPFGIGTFRFTVIALPSALRSASPRNTCPSPLPPTVSQLGLAKNWRRYGWPLCGPCVSACAFTVDALMVELALVRTGQLRRSLAPVSPSVPSFAVTPSPKTELPRSMPRPVLPMMRFAEMRFWFERRVPVVQALHVETKFTTTPALLLLAMTFASPLPVPPMVALNTLSRRTPGPPLPRGRPSASSPIVLPWITWPLVERWVENLMRTPLSFPEMTLPFPGEPTTRLSASVLMTP